jgi:hypothetical protein
MIGGCVTARRAGIWDVGGIRVGCSRFFGVVCEATKQRQNQLKADTAKIAGYEVAMEGEHNAGNRVDSRR